MDTIKLSVVLPEPLHQELKLVAVRQRSSLQKLMEDAAKRILLPEPPEVGASTVEEPVELTSREIQAWTNKLKSILESGDQQLVSLCTGFLNAMSILAENKEALNETTETLPVFRAEVIQGPRRQVGL